MNSVQNRDYPYRRSYILLIQRFAEIELCVSHNHMHRRRRGRAVAVSTRTMLVLILSHRF